MAVIFDEGLVDAGRASGLLPEHKAYVSSVLDGIDKPIRVTLVLPKGMAGVACTLYGKVMGDLVYDAPITASPDEVVRDGLAFYGVLPGTKHVTRCVYRQARPAAELTIAAIPRPIAELLVEPGGDPADLIVIAAYGGPWVPEPVGANGLEGAFAWRFQQDGAADCRRGRALTVDAVDFWREHARAVQQFPTWAPIRAKRRRGVAA